MNRWPDIVRRWFAGEATQLPQPVDAQTATAPPQPQQAALLQSEELADAAETLQKHGTLPGPWNRFRHRHLRLPDWFRRNLVTLPLR